MSEAVLWRGAPPPRERSEPPLRTSESECASSLRGGAAALRGGKAAACHAKRAPGERQRVPQRPKALHPLTVKRQPRQSPLRRQLRGHPQELLLAVERRIALDAP